MTPPQPPPSPTCCIAQNVQAQTPRPCSNVRPRRSIPATPPSPAQLARRLYASAQDKTSPRPPSSHRDAPHRAPHRRQYHRPPLAHLYADDRRLRRRPNPCSTPYLLAARRTTVHLLERPRRSPHGKLASLPEAEHSPQTRRRQPAKLHPSLRDHWPIWAAWPPRLRGLRQQQSTQKVYLASARSVRATVLPQSPVHRCSLRPQPRTTSFAPLSSSRRKSFYQRVPGAAAGDKFPDEEWEARHRLIALEQRH